MPSELPLDPERDEEQAGFRWQLATDSPGFRAISIPCVFGTLLGLSSCQRAEYRSPSVDVLGSYFPAWMVCIIVGLFLTLIIRIGLAALKLDKVLRPSGLVHLCLWAFLTLGTWIVLYKN